MAIKSIVLIVPVGQSAVKAEVLRPFIWFPCSATRWWHNANVATTGNHKKKQLAEDESIGPKKIVQGCACTQTWLVLFFLQEKLTGKYQSFLFQSLRFSQIRRQCQSGPFLREDQTLEFHVWPQSQTDCRERARGHHTSHLPPELVEPVLQRGRAHAAGPVRRPALLLRMCGGEWRR